MLRSALQLCTALVVVGGLVAPHVAVAANYVKAAQDALKKGDLRTAEIELRNAVRDDPQNASLRFELAQVELHLADPSSAQRDAQAAADRGFDPHKALPLLGEAMLMQGHAKQLLNELKPAGKDPQLDAQTDLLRGEAELQLGNKTAARKSFADAEQTYPQGVDAWIADARLSLAEGDKAGAKERIDHALSAQPKSQEALVLKSAMMASSGDRAGALALLDKVITEQPPALAARVQRAAILLSEGKRDQATKDVDAVLTLTPGNIQALFLRASILHAEGKNRDASAILQKLQPTFDQLPRGYLLTALVSEANGQTQLAEENAAKYIARVPQDVGGYVVLSQIYLKDNRPDLALQPLTQAVQAGRTNAAIYEMLGRAELAVRRPDLASDAFAKLRELAPGNVQVLIQSSQALIAAGHPDQALQLIQDALQKNPKAEGLQDALVSSALATGDIGKAKAALGEVKKLAGDTPSTENLTAVVQIADLDATGAVQTLTPLVKAHPEMKVARINLARALGLLGKGQEAQDQLQAVVESDPAAEPALSLLVSNAERRNQMPQAIALLEKAHQAAPKNDQITAQLGAAYLRTKQPEKALDLARSAEQSETQPSAAALDVMANAQVALKHFDDARGTFNQLLGMDPRAIEARRQYVAMLVQQGDYEGARTVLRQGMAATPRVYQLELDYALVDLKASGIDKALQTAEQLHQQDLTFAPLGALKGDIYMAANKPADALAAYQKTFANAPSALILGRLVTAYTKLDQLPKARELLAGWVAKNPKDYAALSELSGIDISLKNYKDAKAELATLVAFQPRNGALLNNLAWVDQQLGDSDALPIAQKAYMLSPTPQTADTLGWILTTQGEPAKGVELLRQAAGSGDPRIAYHLAVALKDVGRKDEAVHLLDAVAKVQGNFAEKTDAQKLLGQMGKGS